MTPSQSLAGTPPLDSEISASHGPAPVAQTDNRDNPGAEDTQSVNAQLFIDPMLGVPLSFYVHEDTADREAVMKAIKRHGGTIVKTYSTTQYILVNPKKEGGQSLWRLYSHKRGRVVLDAQWIFECIRRDSIVSMGHIYHWGGFKVKGNEMDVLGENPSKNVHGAVPMSSSTIERTPSPSIPPTKDPDGGNNSNPPAESPHQQTFNPESTNSLKFGMPPGADARTSGGGHEGPVILRGYGGATHGEPSGPGAPNTPTYSMLPWTDGPNQTYYPFYNAAQQAYLHPQPSGGSHPHAGSSSQQPHTHSPSAGGTPEGVRPVPAADRPRGRKRKRTPEPPTDASLLVRPTAPARRSPTPPKQSVTSSRGGNRFTQADVTYLHKYINYCRDMGHMLSLREICEKLAIKAPHHSFFSWRRYCNRHKIRIGSFSMEDATPGEGNLDHDDDDNKEPSHKDREVEREASNKDNDDQTQPPEPLNAAESSRPVDSPQHEGTQDPALQSPSLQTDPNIDPMLMTTGIKPRATDAASSAVSPDDGVNPITTPISVPSATGETSTAPEGSQSAPGGTTYANASATSSAPLTLAPDEPQAPKVLARSTSGKGIAFTAEDVEFLVRFMAYRRRQESGDLSMSQFWTDVTQRAPHHSRASWMKYWRRHHHELDGTPDDKPVTVPQAKRTRYSYDDDVCLARFFSTHPEGIQDAVFRQFAAENPHHPWKGWQEHYRLHRAQILHLIGRLERGENINERVDEIIDAVPP